MPDQPKPAPKPTAKQLAAENDALRARLNDVEETLHAIRSGEADALVLSDAEGDHVLTLKGGLEPYRVMVEAMNDGAVTLGVDGSILYANRCFAEWVKVPPGQIVGRPLQGMLAEQNREGFEAMLVQGAKGVIRKTLTLQASDGTQKPVQFSMSPLPQSKGQAISVVIADLSKEIAAVRASSRLALIVESSDDAIVSTTLDGVVESWNKAAEKLYGYTAGKALGQPIDALIVPPERMKEVKSELAAIRERKRTLLEDTVRLRKDGSQVEVSIKASPILDDAGKVVGVSINARDITERKRIEQIALEEKTFSDSLVNNLPDIFFLLDAQGCLVQWNERLAELLGLSPEEMLGADPLKYFHEEDKPRVAQKIQQVFATGSASIEARMNLTDGLRDYLLSGNRIETRLGTNLIGFGLDITERKQAEARLRESELAYRTLAQNLPGVVYRVHVREHGRMEFYNEAVAQLTGYTSEGLAGGTLCSIEPLILDEDRPGVVTEVTNAMEEHRPFTLEYRLRHKNGNLLWMTEHGMPVYGPDDKPLYIDGVIFDITTNKQAEKQLQLFRTLIDNSSDAIEVLDPVSLRFLDINETQCRDLGYSREELLSMKITDITPDLSADRLEMIEEQIRKTGSARFESMHQRKDGSTFPVEVSSKLVELDRPYALNIVRNITERKRAMTELKASEEKFRTIFDHARDGIIVMSLDEHAVKFANRSMERMLGYGPGELVGLALPALHPPEALAEVARRFEEDTHRSRSNVLDMPMQTKDGRVLYADLSSSPVDIGGKRYQLGAFRDATERRASELSLRRANRALQTLSAGNLALVRAASEDELLKTITSVIVEQGGYVQAGVHYAEDGQESSLTSKAWSGDEGDHFCPEYLGLADSEQGQLPIAKAIRSGKTQICHDIALDPAFQPFKDRAVELGYVANIALPLSDGKRTFGGLCIYASEASAFDDEEIHLLEELANDLAYGIVTMRIRKEHEQHAMILQQSLEQSIQTIADTVEARDPYTAGHQRRVAELAAAIAQEMGLPEEQVHGIHLAGTVHDLGKIHTPMEILTKPGKLSDIEYQLVQTHPQDGYDILKDVPFPWPIAEIVLQHHERLDGSGYPQGLKDGEILLESKIMAVADVVEAMSSHRPYRAGIGIEMALAEIERGRGTQYDPTAVDACIRLFRERGYHIPD